jgi:hypothetical protein
VRGNLLQRAGGSQSGCLKPLDYFFEFRHARLDGKEFAPNAVQFLARTSLSLLLTIRARAAAGELALAHQLGLDDPIEIVAAGFDESRDVGAALLRERQALFEWLVAFDAEGQFAAAGLD